MPSAAPSSAPAPQRSSYDFSSLDPAPALLQSSLFIASNSEPDADRKKVQLTTAWREVTGEDLPWRNIEPNDLARKLRRRVNEETLKTSPTLARLYEDPKFASLSFDETEQLSALEQRARSRTLGDVGRDVAVTAVKGAVGLPQAFVGLLDIPTGGRVGKTLDSAGFRFNETQKILQSMYSPAQQAANREVQNAEGFLETIITALQNPSVIATTVGESVPQMLGGAAVARGLLAAVPRLSPLLAGAVGEGTIAAGAAAEQIRAQTPDELLSVKQSLSALGSGAGTALFGAAGGKFAQKLKIDDIDTVLARGGLDKGAAETVKKGFVRRLAEGGIAEGAFEELPQSAQEQMWQNFATDRPIMEGVANAAAMGLLSGMVMGGGFNVLAGLQNRQQDQVQRAQANLQYFTEMTTQAANVQMRVADPQAFQRYMQEIDSEVAYLDPKELQESGVDLNVLSQALPSVAEQLAEAAQTGQDIVIPRDELFTRLPGSGLEQSLLPILRATAEDPSAKQAEQQMAQAATFFQAETEKLIAQQQVNDATMQSMQAVEQDVLRQLKETNRFTEDVNAAYAKLMSSFFGTLAARLNKAGQTATAQELYQKFALRVNAQNVAGEQQLDQNTPEFQKWSEGSVVRNPDGSMRVAYHATTADVSELKPGGNDPSVSGPAIWVGFDKEQYAAAHNVGGFGGQYREGTNVMPVYVSIKNPLVVTPENRGELAQRFGGGFPKRMSQATVDALVAEGFDGIVDQSSPDFGEEAVVFRPEQIKSIFNARPTNDPNILKQSAAFATEEVPAPLRAISNPQRASLKSDFTKSGIADVLKRSDWTILTGENPFATKLDKMANQRRNDDLRKRLEELGLEFIEVKGKYGNEENSFVVLGVTKDQALELGKQFGQESVLTNAGLVFTKDGSINPARGVDVLAKDAEDYYTLLPDGTKFSIKIDTSDSPKVWPAQDGRVGEVSVAGVHFSKAERSLLDPRFYGRGARGAEYDRVKNAEDKRLGKRVHFYVNTGAGVRAEADVGNVAHVARIANLYDVDGDPLGIWKGDANTKESAVLDAGFSGYLSRNALGGTAVVFENVNVTPVGNEAAANALVANITLPSPQMTANQKLAREAAQDPRLVNGAQTAAAWQDDFTKYGYDIKVDTSKEGTFYKDEILRQFYQMPYLPKTKVVDSNGNPLRMFHGSNADIQKLEIGADDGFYLSSDPDYAAGYGKVKADVFGGNPTLYPVYLDLRNPLELDGADAAVVDKYTSRGYSKKALEAKGYDGIILRHTDGEVEAQAFRPEQVVSATGGSFGQGEQSRGQITFGNDITQSPTTITLLKNADLSTFLHEAGHFYLEVLNSVATQADAPAEIVEDMNRILAWFGIKGDESVKGGERGGDLAQSAVESDAFKRWFEGSKVVDAAGKPLVVYHGTSEKFETFEGDVWLSDRDTAATYGPNVMPLYVSLKNPLVVDADYNSWANIEFRGDEYKSTQDIVDVAKSEGYDGVIFENVIDNADTGTEEDISTVYVAFRPEQIKSAVGNRGTFDPNDPSILRQADEQLTEPASLPAGRTPLDVWNAMSLEEKRPYHEKFARGFEAYLFEGKAPSVELKGLFSRFRAWLLNVYRQLTALNVELNDEVRGVFDRMLATEAQIKEAESLRGMAPLFKTAEEMGATPDEWAAYQQQHGEATETAMEQLEARSLRDMRWLANARSRTLRKLQKDAAAKRKAVEAEVQAEVRQQPVYAAQRWLKYGELPDGTQTAGAKLDLKALKEMYGEGPAAPWRYLATGERGMAGNEGLHPDVAAEMFGFSSGDAMVKAILAAEPETTVVEGMTDQRMLERYGDLSSPAAQERAADEAIHNEARGRFIATEMAALANAMRVREDTGRTVTDSRGRTRKITTNVLIKAAKDFASSLVDRKKLKDIRPSQFTSAEARAAKAAESTKNFAEKVTEKRNQLVNHYAAKYANEAVDYVEKQVAYLRKVGESETIDPEYRDQIHQLLEKVELRRITEREERRRTSLLEWIESQEAAGLDPVIDRALVEQASVVNYRNMTLEEFKGLVDAVKNIEHLGRLKKKLLTAKDQRELAAVVQELQTSITDNANREAKVRIETGRGVDRIGKMARGFIAAHRKFASIIREMDGGKDGGAMWERFVRGMNEAGDNEVTMRAQATEKMAGIFKLLDGIKLTRKEQVLPGVSLTREAQIMLALNWGNEGNRQRVIDGGLDGKRRLTPAEAESVIFRLSDKEWDFVEAIWALNESYRPMIAEQEKRITGVEPKWIEASPFVLPSGRQIKGGYMPAKYDADLSTRSNELEAVTDLRQQMKGAAGRSATRNGYTKERSQEVKDRPLRKDFGVIMQHLGEVTHRLAWQDWLIDANRLLKGIDGVVREHYGPEILKQMKDQLRDIAQGDISAQSDLDRILGHIRSGVTIAGMGWNLATGLMQPLGVSQSIVRIGSDWFAKGLAHFSAHPVEATKLAQEKSKFMASRSLQLNRDFTDILNKIDKEKLSAVQNSYFWFIYKFQTAVDVPTWWGAYEKAIAEGNDEARSIALADQAVIDSQGGGHLKDQAAIQRGGAGQKLFTAFYSFFNTTYNLAVEQGRTAVVKGGMAMPKLASDYALLFVIPAMAGALIKMALKGEDFDDEEKLAKKLAAEQLNYLLGTMILTREIGGGISAAVEGFPYTGPAALRVFGEIAKFSQQSVQGEIDAPLLKAANNVAGILLHYPAGQVQRTVEGMVALSEGDTQNPAALLFGPPRE